MAKTTKPKRVALADMTPAARRQRIAVLAANPGTRSKIPDKFLPKQYQKARATAQRVKQENATLYNPAQILSGGDLRKAVKSEVDLQINPQVSAYNREIGAVKGERDASLRRVGEYFAPYQQAVQQSAANLSSSGQQLAQQLASIGQGTQNAIQGFQDQANKRAQADAALRGPGLSDTQPVNQAFDFEKGMAASQAGTYQAQGAAQSYGSSQLANTIAATAPMRAQDTMGRLANQFNQQLTDFYGKKADVEASRGDLTASTLNKMREDQFTNLATMKGLDIKQADLNETVRSHQATEKLTGDAITARNLASIRTARTAHERNVATKQYNQAQIDIKRGVDPITGKRIPKNVSSADALSAWKLKFAQEHGYLPTTGAPKGGPGSRADTKDIQKFQQKYPSIATQISGVAGQLSAGKLKDNSGKVVTGGRNYVAQNYIAAHPNADPLMVGIAVDMHYDGHISKRHQKQLQQRGLKVKDLEGVTPASAGRPSRRAATKIPGTRP